MGNGRVVELLADADSELGEARVSVIRASRAVSEILAADPDGRLAADFGNLSAVLSAVDDLLAGVRAVIAGGPVGAVPYVEVLRRLGGG